MLFLRIQSVKLRLRDLLAVFLKGKWTMYGWHATSIILIKQPKMFSFSLAYRLLPILYQYGSVNLPVG